MGRNQCKLLDDTAEIADFADQVLNKTNLAWSVHVAGGNSYKCSIYQQSNASQMSITHVDMLKAALLGSKFTTHDMTVCDTTVITACNMRA